MVFYLYIFFPSFVSIINFTHWENHQVIFCFQKPLIFFHTWKSRSNFFNWQSISSSHTFLYPINSCHTNKYEPSEPSVSLLCQKQTIQIPSAQKYIHATQNFPQQKCLPTLLCPSKSHLFFKAQQKQKHERQTCLVIVARVYFIHLWIPGYTFYCFVSFLTVQCGCLIKHCPHLHRL